MPVNLLEFLSFLLRINEFLPHDAHALQFSIDEDDLIFRETECLTVNQSLDHPKPIDDLSFSWFAAVW